MDSFRCYAATVLLSVGLAVNPAQGQVIPDGSLPTGVTSPDGRNFAIDGGARSGNNLFHSFSQFSVPTNGSAVFNNAADVQNIFSRVTGGAVSNIDGLIQTNGSASLFLLNPNGLLFGPNARLQIGGSLIGTTASSIKFADNTEFSASNPTPLLTMSVPIGLQMGTNAGPIAIEGPPINNFFLRPPTLAMAPNQTLALIGGQIDFNSATIAAPDNRVELWAMRDGSVDISSLGNWQLANASRSPVWGDINLQQYAYLNTSGANGGSINIRGRGLTLRDGSHIESATGANGRGQGINVQTTEFVNLLGVAQAINYTPPGLATTVSGSGATAGDIIVDTQRLSVTNGGWISSLNWGSDLQTFTPINDAKTGEIRIRAADLEISGYTPSPHPLTGVYVSSAITTLVSGGQQNNSGAITVNAERVRLSDGGRISTDLLGIPTLLPRTTGQAGNISVTATENLEISGTGVNNFTSAIISSIQNWVEGQGGDITIQAKQLSLAKGGTISSAIAGTPIAAFAGQGKAGNIIIQAGTVQISDPVIDSFSQGLSGITVALGQNSSGQGGSVNLNADRLTLFNGGQIISSSEGAGTAGNVNLNATAIDIQGKSQSPINGQFLPSGITASSSTGFAAGSVNITADSLIVQDGANLTVSNIGIGDAGNLNVNARNIFLDNRASFSAEVNGGSQGNINLQAQEVLLLRRGSNITTNAQGASTGGNINIKAAAIVGIPQENSDIVANAVLGSGGNINITTRSILGSTGSPVRGTRYGFSYIRPCSKLAQIAHSHEGQGLGAEKC
ncbi:MAG: filamentous hemagglutinin N-terminal domain-containing protein, partial [Alkalinema sp. RU_4_3]|nr:filamentous hemagglutinin N-terminal domain-containing protein [Alkalinema sp. RU_4_3]